MVTAESSIVWTNKYQFPAVREFVPEGERGEWQVKHFTVDRTDSMWTAITHDPFGYVPPGDYTKLVQGRTIWMSDTRMERITCAELLDEARGEVLIAGLGLGMVLPPLVANETVTGITVVELYQEVIDLIAPHYQHPKISVAQGDIFQWAPAEGQKFDTIWFDIWPDRNTDNLVEMARLHQKGKYWKRDKTAWMNSWYRHWLKADRRRDGSY